MTFFCVVTIKFYEQEIKNIDRILYKKGVSKICIINNVCTIKYIKVKNQNDWLFVSDCCIRSPTLRSVTSLSPCSRVTGGASTIPTSLESTPTLSHSKKSLLAVFGPWYLAEVLIPWSFINPGEFNLSSFKKKCQRDFNNCIENCNRA